MINHTSYEGLERVMYLQIIFWGTDLINPITVKLFL